MLAEGAIHGIPAQCPRTWRWFGEDLPASPRAPITASWRGTYNNSFPIQLDIATWSGSRFDGL